MGSRVSEARRCFSILGFILLIAALIGSKLPWLEIDETDHIHTWKIVDDEDPDQTTSTCSFSMIMYFNLMTVEACQTYTSSYPDECEVFLNKQLVCTELTFSDLEENTLDIHEWGMYSAKCQPAGQTAFILLIITLILLSGTVLISTFKNIQRKCCPKIYQQQHGKAKCIIPTCAFFAPLCGAIAVLLYFVQCINTAKGHELVEDVNRSVTGYKGFWLAVSGTICLVLWWILFTIWFCNKKVDANVDFSGGSSHRDGTIGGDTSRTKRKPLPQDSEDEEDSDDDNSRIQLAKKTPEIADPTPAGNWRDSD